MKRIISQRWAQVALGTTAAEYLRLVASTTRFVIEPQDIYDRLDRDLPAIIALWHGQHLLAPFIRRAHHRAKVLISRHRDGEINAIAAERLGIETIRGSGAPGGGFARKGGVGAFTAMLEALDQGYNVATTADVPKVARVVGMGIVKLAQFSGRPIFPVAVATRHRIELKNWDRTAVNLPFGRGAGVAAGPIWVPADADEARLQEARRAVEDQLNEVTRRAYEIVDARRG